MQSFGLILDFSPGSLAALDAYITSTYGTEGKLAEDKNWAPSDGILILCVHMGAYLGECIRKFVDGRWDVPNTDPPDYFQTALILETEQGPREVNPIAEVLRRYSYGTKNSLFKVFSLLVPTEPSTSSKIALSLKETATRFESQQQLPSSTKFSVAADLYELALQFSSSADYVERQYVNELRHQIAASTPPSAEMATSTRAEVKIEEENKQKSQAASESQQNEERIKAALEYQIAESKNDPIGIFSALESLVKHDPGNRDAKRKLAIMYDIFKREPAQAIEILQQLISEHPTDPVTMNALALVYTRNAQLPEAQAVYNEVLLVDPLNREAFLALLKGDLREGKREEAYSQLHKRTREDPNFPEAWSTLAALQMFDGQLEEAKRSFAHAISVIEPGVDKEFLAQLNRDIWDLENHSSTTDPTRASAAFKSALKFWNEKNFRKALPFLDEAMKQDPFNPDYYRCAAYAAFEEAHFELSLKYSRVLQRLAPDTSVGWLQEGNIHLREKRIDDAIRAFELATKWAPKEFKSWFSLCVAYRLARRFEDALSAWLTARRFADPKSSDLNNLMKEQIHLQNAKETGSRKLKQIKEKRGFFSRLF